MFEWFLGESADRGPCLGHEIAFKLFLLLFLLDEFLSAWDASSIVAHLNLQKRMCGLLIIIIQMQADKQSESRKTLTILTEDEKDMEAIAQHGFQDSSEGDEPDILGSMEKQINLRTEHSSVTSLHHNTPKDTTKRIKGLAMHEDHNDSTTRHIREFSFKNPTNKVTPLLGDDVQRKLETKRSDTEQVTSDDMNSSFIGLKEASESLSRPLVKKVSRRNMKRSSQRALNESKFRSSLRLENQMTSRIDEKKYEKELKRVLKKSSKKNVSLYDLRRKSTRKLKKNSQYETEYIETLNIEEKKEYVKDKWLFVAQKAFLMGSLIVVFRQVDKQVQMFGTSRRVVMKDPPPVVTNRKKSKVRSNHSQLINPDSLGKRLWDVYIGCLLIYTALLVPYRLAFEDDTPVGWFAFDLYLDSMFMLDILLNFFTGYYDKEDELSGPIMDCKKIALNYLKGWLFLDVIATFPFQLIELYFQTGGTRYNKLLRLLRLPRLYRLIRLFKCVRLMKMSSVKKCCQFMRINEALKRLLVVSAMALFFSHLISCLWYLIAKIDDFSEHTWVSRKDINNESTSFKYLMSFYWTIQTITTVGFGDIGSRTTLEMTLSLVWMIFGVGFYSYVIGNFSSMIAAVDQKNRELQNRLMTLDKFQEEQKISENLYLRIKIFLEENAKVQDYENNKKEVLGELPPQLKIEVMKQTHGEMIESLRFFDDKIWNFIWTTIPKLTQMNFTKYELIYREQDVASECFLIMKGRVTICTPDARIYRKFFRGAHFGEYSLFNSTLRKETAVTDTKCQFYVLSKQAFHQIIEEFPKEARELKKEAELKDEVLTRARLAMLKKNQVYPHPRIEAVLNNAKGGLDKGKSIQDTLVEKGWKNEIDVASQLYVYLIKNSPPRPITRRHSTNVLSSKSTGAIKGHMKIRRCKSFEELDSLSVVGEPPSKMKTGPVTLYRADNQNAEQFGRIQDKTSVWNILDDGEFMYGKTPLLRPRASESEAEIKEKEKERERFKKRKETMLIEEISSKRKPGFQMPASLEHAPSLSIPVNLEQAELPVEQTAVMSIVKEFNKSVKMLTASSYQIFRTLNSLQEDADKERASIKQSLDIIIKQQQSLEQKLTKE